ncbi:MULTISPECIES: DUF6691 family protein [unclassified Massilia]|uniref:DUF6691 family protein n=1 Tax=unclassified Massilia TaxID=2609279 RepID=UPI00177B30BC|nr:MULTISPECIES: DUF6691 family protein [unclassified Massilia]MBD8528585.1 YeeE/YedE family protein [Massilia sp. CFBP 13647]MBD8671792.1 YeeE/YedE family protein [Massilia sp. CFBP 13721]
MVLAAAFAIGLLFGIGLILSGLTDPGKVLAFLDLAGAWDPSLLCTMGGATVVAAMGFRLARSRRTALLGAPMRLPAGGAIDRRLALGSVIFGVGWGLAGFCPGPALASLGTGLLAPLLFVAAMVAGMGLFALFERIGSRRAA